MDMSFHNYHLVLHLEIYLSPFREVLKGAYCPKVECLSTHEGYGRLVDGENSSFGWENTIFVCEIIVVPRKISQRAILGYQTMLLRISIPT